VSFCPECEDGFCCICDGTAESCPDQPEHPYMGRWVKTVETVTDEPTYDEIARIKRLEDV
jgi:hypothetical protein